MAFITLITGTRKGIGYALVRHYVKCGHVVVGCSRSPFTEQLDKYDHFELDVADEPAVKSLFRYVRKKYGRLDHLINNAGIAMMNHSLTTPVSAVEKMLRTNVLGSFLFCREAAKLMRKNRFGRIVNLTTVAIPLRLEGESVYAASKHAVLMLTEILAKEYANLGITINAVGPGPVQTDLIKNVGTQTLEKLLGRLSISEYTTAKDICNVIDFFLQPESRLITGQHIYIGGVQ